MNSNSYQFNPNGSYAYHGNQNVNGPFSYYPNGNQGQNQNSNFNPSSFTPYRYNPSTNDPYDATSEQYFCNDIIPTYTSLTQALTKINTLASNFTIAENLASGINDQAQKQIVINELENYLRDTKNYLDYAKTTMKYALQILGLVDSSYFSHYKIQESKKKSIDKIITEVLKKELNKKHIC